MTAEGWKTIVTAAIILLLSFLVQITGVEIFPGEQEAVVAGIIALIMIALRVVTKTPVGKSE